MTTQATMEAPATQTIITFAAPIPGFPDARTFALEPWGGGGSPFSLLRCAEIEGLDFVVVSPAVFFADYEPELDDATVELLGLETADDVVLVVVITLGDSVADATANLLGPIVINRHTNQAAQAILHDADLSTKAPIVAT